MAPRSVFLLVSVLIGCGGGAGRFPLRDPLWRDTDLDPVSVPCESRPDDEDPEHVACTPEEYVSTLVWDGADNSFFRPVSQAFTVDPGSEAVNVNAFDEVPDSAWFQNRLGKRKPSREELLRGACTDADRLFPDDAAPGSWLIDQGKPNGASPGFRVRVDGRKYMLKTDVKSQPERPSAASVIGAALYHAVGYNTTCEQIVYFDPEILTLKPGLTATDNSGEARPFDAAALQWVLGEATRRGDRVRMQASAWLPGYLLGPFKYEGTRADDPNDVIPHEDRRDLRGARVLAAWINHFDSREQNSMDSWIASNPEVPDSSPGFVRHYFLDTSDSFGSEWAWDGISRRLGRSYVLDWGDVGLDFVTLGIPRRPWDCARRSPGFEQFGYFHYRDFDPDAWKNEYMNPAFSRATERDNAWMARILSRFDRADIDALVSLGQFSGAEQAAFLAEVLERRLRRILQRYFSVLSPVSDLEMRGENRLCALDLARRRQVAMPSQFQYRASFTDRSGTHPLPVEVLPGGESCVALPRGAHSPKDPRYLVLRIDNGVSRYPLLAHLYDLGERGYRLVGIERPDSAEAEIAREAWVAR